MDAIKLYETTAKMLTFMVLRVYKQRSEKTTATSVRTSAGNQGSWFEKMKIKGIFTRSWDACL